jgi:nitroreductase
MSLIDKVLSRRSIRAYAKKRIPTPVLNNILEAGRQAPSAGNRQPWHFIVVTDEEIKQTLSWGRVNWFIRDAPLTIVGCANTDARNWSIMDATIALQNMVIAAWAMGVGSCWLGSFKEGDVKQLLNIPDNWKVVALVTFGYPAEGESRFPANFQDMRERLTTKKPIKKIVSFNTFQAPRTRNIGC